MSKVVVEYDYIAKEPDELTIRKGDIITDVIKKLGGWWEGVLKDKKGMFPDNFVRPLDEDLSVVLRNQKDVSRIRQCRVVFSYNQDHEDELNLKVGDVIDIVGEEEEGWWRGKLNGKEGVFPSNFVKELTWLPSPTTRSVSNNENEFDNKAPTLPAKPTKQLCEATFPYKGQNEDELSFQENDIITVLNRDTQDPGWWLGELNGKTGVFPDNFVVLISDNKISNKENRKSAIDKSAIKSVSVASQRKSLDQKKEIDINSEPKKPDVDPNKPNTAVKKSSNAGLGIISEIKKKIEDVVDGSIGSKHVTISEESSTNSENDFDFVERRSLLTDVRATRAKAPGRRPPTVPHKEDAPIISNNTHSSEEQIVDTNVKPRLREWEKHKAPWLEEMKKNQVRRTMMTTFEENPPENEANLKLEKLSHESKPLKESKSPQEIKPFREPKTPPETKPLKEVKSPPEIKPPREAKSPPGTKPLKEVKHLNDLEKNIKPHHELSKHSITLDAQDIPEIASRVLFKETSPLTEIKRENSADILERLDRLENIVRKQNRTIEELQTKLQKEIDLRILLQEEVKKLKA